MSKKKLGYGCGIAFLLGIILFVYTCTPPPRTAEGYHVWKKIELPNNTNILIAADQGDEWWYIDRGCFLYYVVQTKNRTTKGEMLGFYSCENPNSGSPDFKTVTADEGSIVGIFECHCPNILLGLVDFRDSRSDEEMLGVISREKGQNYKSLKSATDDDMKNAVILEP